jgi:predicted TIM-barrel fold metal-dependent hydrolase
LCDPNLAAQEVYRNARRGFHAVSFTENPSSLGYPSIHTDHWDPFLRACAETDTVINLHVGSSGNIPMPSPDSPGEVMVALFPVNGIESVVDWIYSGVPVRFPTLKVALSEAGVSWVPMVIERLRRAYRHRDVAASRSWPESAPEPVEVLHRNFWYTSIEDPAAFRNLDVIGEDRVMLEVDYPHTDSTWPDSQALFESELHHLSPGAIQKICVGTAAELYQHRGPPDGWLLGSTNPLSS